MEEKDTEVLADSNWIKLLPVLISISYLLASVVGVLYSYWLLLRFQITLSYYAVPEDFFISALTRPLVLILSVITLPAYFISQKISIWFVRKRYRLEVTKKVERAFFYILLIPTLIAASSQIYQQARQDAAET